MSESTHFSPEPLVSLRGAALREHQMACCRVRERGTLRQALTNLAANQITATKAVAFTLTLKQSRSILSDRGRFTVKLTHQEAERQGREFIHRLNRRFYGRAYRSGHVQLQSYLRVEVDANENLHLHGAVQVPGTRLLIDMKDAIRACWKKSDWALIQQLDVRPIYSNSGWANYTSKQGVDSLVL